MKNIKKIFVNLLIFLGIIHKKIKGRRYLSDVKTGDMIVIEHEQFAKRYGRVLCVNNDTLTKKLFLRITWDMGNNKTQEQRIVVPYNSYMVKNFNLLNPIMDSPANEVDETDISSLQSKLNKYIEEENYEEAKKLQEKIDKLAKKK